MTEKLCLKWNDFQENTNAAFGSLRNDNDFSDITLACEDGQQVEAHKVILAATFLTALKLDKNILSNLAKIFLSKIFPYASGHVPTC